MKLQAYNHDLYTQAALRATEMAKRDPDVGCATASSADLAYLKGQGPHCIGYVVAACQRYAAHPCVGWRQPKSPFTTQTYAEIWLRVQKVATAWHASGQVNAGDCVGICGFASPDWFVSYLACLYVGAVSVPLRTSANSGELAHIINETACRTIICSAEQLPPLHAALCQAPEVKNVVVMDDSAWQTGGVPSPLTPSALSALEALGATHPTVPYWVPPEGTDPLLTLLYTSGSTGAPKGAGFCDSVLSYAFSAPLGDLFPPCPMISVGYLPLNHLAGLGMLLHGFMHGGVTHFVQKSDMSTLFSDIQAARPTFLMLVPRVSEMLFSRYQSECSQRGGVAAQADVLGEMHDILGDRLCCILTATAPTSPYLADFLRSCLGVPVIDSYGSTENGGTITLDNTIMDIVSDFQLTDLPDLGYYVADKPYPRGELSIKSPRLITSYYKDPDASASLRDATGFMKTGDIMEQRGPREFQWIDRKSNIIKLSQGEFVSVTQLEALFVGGSGAIEQAYIYGNSHRSFVLAVLVPCESVVAARLGPHASADEIKNMVRQEVNRIAHQAGLRGYETPRDFILETQAFTKDNGLLTESGKPARNQLRKHYGPVLESLYNQLAAANTRNMDNLQKWKSLSLAARVQKAVTSTLGIPPAQPQATMQQSFAQLGGDSLNAVQLGETLRYLCGTAPPMGMLLSRTSTLQDLANFIQQHPSCEDSSAFAMVHGTHAKNVRADQLSLNHFIPDAADLNRNAQSIEQEPARTVLLTGANGYLGRFLLQGLLDEVRPTDGKIVCIVRGKDNKAALQRLYDSYVPGASELAGRLRRLADLGKLEVWAGDLMLRNMGLTPDVYARLAAEVDTIVHCGALVNHALSYEQLFEPNVVGTIEVIRFALQSRRKSINFISSVAVMAGLDRPVFEYESAAALWPVRNLSSGYAAGYATSKWACEVLLEQLNTEYGNPLNVFRCSLVLAHSSIIGQLNPSDFLSRLVYGIIKTTLAPNSFYSHPQRQAFDGLPVDFVAQAISQIATRQRTGLHRYHVVSPQQNDGISLDALIRWVETAGYPLHYLSPYGTWLDQFGSALERLPASQRALSPWSILHQWQEPPDSIECQWNADKFKLALTEFTDWQNSPRLSEAFIHRFVRGLELLGLIVAPAGPAKAKSTIKDGRPDKTGVNLLT